jgi:hypothetical protein
MDFIYDIACEYHKKLPGRLQKYGSQLPDWVKDIMWRFFIPKFHIPAHGPKCQTRFSLNWISGNGRTYGEQTEQEWAHVKKAASATREQGGGARRLTLDNIWAGWNWYLTTALGT